jgi:hypothetical protein
MTTLALLALLAGVPANTTTTTTTNTASDMVYEGSIEDAPLGDIDRQQIVKQVRKSFGAINKCYTEELNASPDLAGKMVVKFTIGADGKVVEAHAQYSNLHDPALEGCVVKQFEGLEFPAFGGVGEELRITYPIDFAPSTPKKKR